MGVRLGTGDAVGPGVWLGAVVTVGDGLGVQVGDGLGVRLGEGTTAGGTVAVASLPDQPGPPGIVARMGVARSGGGTASPGRLEQPDTGARLSRVQIAAHNQRLTIKSAPQWLL